jgi:hypothetical protein
MQNDYGLTNLSGSSLHFFYKKLENHPVSLWIWMQNKIGFRFNPASNVTKEGDMKIANM